MLRQRKRSMEGLRAPYAAVSPRQPVTRVDPVPAGEASLHPDSLLRGGCGAQRRRSQRVVEGERGCHALAPEIRLHSWFSARPRGCSSPRRPRNQADNPSCGRPPRVCSPHDVRPSGQWRGAMVRGVPGRTMDARGDMCPQLGPGAAIVPSPAQSGGSGLHARSAPPCGPLSRGDQGRRGGSGDCPGARARRGRVRPSLHAVTLCGASRRARGHRQGARGGQAIRGRACGDVPGVLSSAPRRRLPGAPPPPASPPGS